jgi:hypothetical protein
VQVTFETKLPSETLSVIVLQNREYQNLATGLADFICGISLQPALVNFLRSLLVVLRLVLISLGPWADRQQVPGRLLLGPLILGMDVSGRSRKNRGGKTHLANLHLPELDLREGLLGRSVGEAQRLCGSS